LKIKKFNCAPSTNESVELPTRPQVAEICRSLESKVLGQVYPVNDLIDVVGHFIAKKFRVNVLHTSALEVDQDDINITAYYDSEHDEEGRISIEIVLITNPSDEYLILDAEVWATFTNRLADSLAHELIHMRQSRDRGFQSFEPRRKHVYNLDEAVRYLADPDEIDAYAHNIAVELKECSNPLQSLQNVQTLSTKDSVNLWAYVHAFSPNHPVVKRLVKKIYKLLT